MQHQFGTRALLIGVALFCIVCSIFLWNFWRPIPNALFETSQSGDLATVEKLLAQGADLSTYDGWNGTPLMYASANCNVHIVQRLIAAGASIDERSRRDRTPLMWAARSGCMPVVKYLIDAGADLHLVDAEGKSAIDLATQQGHARIKELLEESAGKEK